MTPADREQQQLDALVAAYRRLPQDEPPTVLDAAILAQARAAVTPRVPPRNWIPAFASAAVVMLAVGLSWQMRDRGLAPVPAATEIAAPKPEPVQEIVVSTSTTAGAPAASVPQELGAAAAESDQLKQIDDDATRPGRKLDDLAKAKDEGLGADTGTTSAADGRAAAARGEPEPFPQSGFASADRATGKLEAPAPPRINAEVAQPREQPVLSREDAATDARNAVESERGVVRHAEQRQRRAQPDAPPPPPPPAPSEPPVVFDEPIVEPFVRSEPAPAPAPPAPAIPARPVTAPTAMTPAAPAAEIALDQVVVVGSRIKEEAQPEAFRDAPADVSPNASPQPALGLAGSGPAPATVAEAKKASASETATHWLERIRKLKHDGKLDAARTEMTAFRGAWPRHRVPRDLRDLMR